MSRVIWIVPVNQRLAADVMQVAIAHHDGFVFILDVARDGVHQRYPAKIAADIRRLMR
jgi:hypothetical protein